MRHGCATVPKLRLSGCQWLMTGWLVALIDSDVTTAGWLFLFCLGLLFVPVTFLPEESRTVAEGNRCSTTKNHSPHRHWGALRCLFCVFYSTSLNPPLVFNCKGKVMFLQTDAPVCFPSAAIWGWNNAGTFRHQNPISIAGFFCICRATNEPQNKEHCDEGSGTAAGLLTLQDFNWQRRICVRNLRP